MTQAAIIIPARYGSTRFPAKILAEVAGLSMIERVYRIAKAAEGDNLVLVATDDERIKKHVEDFGGQAVMTPVDCPNGTDRVYRAWQGLASQPEFILNLQGDAVLTPPWILSEVLRTLKETPEADIVTPSVLLTEEQFNKMRESAYGGKAGGTFVTFNQDFWALYFSKSPIPFVRAGSGLDKLPLYRHIGLYGYRSSALARYVELPQTPLEKVEQLEQLRALEHGMRIKMALVDYRGRTHGSIDNIDDVEKIEAIIAREGELV